MVKRNTTAMDPAHKRKLEANIWKVKLNSFLLQFLVYSPILWMAFQSRGISFVQIGTLLLFGSLVPYLFTVPTGILADKWGRKYVLVLAAGCGVVSMVLWTYEGFVLLLFGMLFRGLIDACVAGTDTALLYDSLKELGREQEYTKHNGRRFSISMLGFGAAAVASSFLPIGGFYPYHFLLTALAFLIAMFVSWSMREPTIHQEAKGRNSWKQLSDAFHNIRTHRELRRVVTYTFVLISSMIMTITYIQFFLRGAGLEIRYFGFIYAVLAGVSALTSHFAADIEDRIGERNMLILLPALLVTGMLLLIAGSGIVVVMAGLLVIETMLGIQGAILNNYMQRHIESSYRSTTESLASFYGGVYRGIMYVLMGITAELFGVQWALGFVLAMMLFFIIPPLWLLVRDADTAKTPASRARRATR